MQYVRGAASGAALLIALLPQVGETRPLRAQKVELDSGRTRLELDARLGDASSRRRPQTELGRRQTDLVRGQPDLARVDLARRPSDLGRRRSSRSAAESRYETVRAIDSQRVQVRDNRVVIDAGSTRLSGEVAGRPQEVVVEIPASHQNLRLADIELVHSQRLADKSSQWSGKKGDRDTTAPYSLVEVEVEGQGWTSLGQRKKFPEARQEVERLHDLPLIDGAIRAVRVRNVGADPLLVHGVTLHFLPQRPGRLSESVFTPRMGFGDPWQARPPTVARDRNRKVNGTRYPKALVLNNTGDWAATDAATLERVKSDGWEVGRDTIRVPLEAGQQFSIAEVMIGDTHPDDRTNNDGSYGYKGFAKLSMTIIAADGRRISLSQNENVPPQGVLRGSTDHVVAEGDRLEIRVQQDTAAVMGVRVGYAPGAR